MDDTCAVCAEPLKWVAYGQCGHREVCSDCVIRLRFICDDRRCCICKSESIIIFVTKALGDYTMRITDFSVFPVDPTEGKVGQYWYHEGTKAFFDDLDHFKTIKATCRFSCVVCDDNTIMDKLVEERPKRSVNFRNIEQLKSHLFHNHKLFMCILCLEGRKVFICEQKLYTRVQLNQHIRSGDSEVDGSEIERGGFMGHPMCEFCQNPFYGDNELYTHMQTEHYTCHMCQRANPGHYEYYKSYHELEMHFQNFHFLCLDEGCLAKKFVVFTSEEELKRHNRLEHGGQMSRSERNAALQIPTSFRYARNTLRLDFTDNEIRAQVIEERRSSFSDDQSDSYQRNTDPPLVSSSEPDSSSSSRTGQTVPLEPSSFPPLPKASKTRRPKPQKNRILDAWPVLGHQPIPATPSSSTSTPPVGHALNYGRVTSSSSAPSSSTSRTLSRGNGTIPSSNNSMARVLVTSSSSAMSSSTSGPAATGNSTVPASNKTMARVLVSAKTNNTAVGPKKDNRSSFEPSISNFPPVSATITNKPEKGSSELLSSKRVDAHTANKSLIEKIRAGLEFDDEKFGVFKVISSEYRQGLIETGEYVAYVHQFGISNLIPELARLCPDPHKQRELLMVCNSSGLRDYGVRIDERKNMSELKPKKGSKKGKEKIEDSIIRNVRELQLSYNLSQERIEVLSKDGYRSNKGKSKVLEVDEPPGLSITDLRLTEQSQENESKKAGGVKKQQKKMSKFYRNRLGDNSPAAILDLSNSNSTFAGENSEDTGNGSGSSRAQSVWQNGGGHKLVSKLVTTKRGDGQ